MRRLWALFLCLFVLCAALRPALPVFVCAGMAGARMARPCCPADRPAADDAGSLTRTWAARCCHAELPATAEQSRPPTAPQRPAVWAAVLVATLPSPPAAPLLTLPPRRQGEPRTIGPPPPLRSPLRI